MDKALDFWKSELKDIDEVFENIKIGKKRKLCKSAGGRDILAVSYGKENSFENRTANYISAVEGKNPKCYKDNERPCVLLVGCIHGAEFEGIVSLLNLINIFETGKDFSGKERKELSKWQNDANIVIIPALNPDGRARVGGKSVVGMKTEEFRKIAQGINLDGTTCQWPQCKQLHPALGKLSFMGGYFNDDGINLMADNFFAPMARETAALLKLCSDLAPDAVVLLHGHAEIGYCGLIPSKYEPESHTKFWESLEEKLQAPFADLKSRFARSARYFCSVAEKSFSLTDACHFSCGAYSTVLESDQGVLGKAEDEELLPDRHKIILESHFAFYEALGNLLLEDMKKRGEENG